MATKRFDLATLDTLLGTQGLIAVLGRDDKTGQIRYASLNRKRYDHDDRIRLSATYAISMPGRGQCSYPLLTLELKRHEGGIKIVSARKMGRLADAAPLADALMDFAKTLSAETMPARAQLAAFLPAQILDGLESNLPATAFPEKGTQSVEQLPQAFWDQPTVVHHDRIDPAAFAFALNLAVGEKAEMANYDIDNGDYRVFHIGLSNTSDGGKALLFELNRHGPGFDPRVFTVLSLKLGSVESDGLCAVESFSCSAGTSLEELPRQIAALARITCDLQHNIRPDDELILQFLSVQARTLWTKPLSGRGAA